MIFFGENTPMRFLLFILLFFTTAAFAITYTEDKPAIQINANQPIFTIQLPSNPTTGYAWFLRENDSNLIVPIQHRFIHANSKKLIGAPGYEMWTFRVRPKGFVVPREILLRFIYTRAWEISNNETQLVFKVTTIPASSTFHSQKLN